MGKKVKLHFWLQMILLVAIWSVISAADVKSAKNQNLNLKTQSKPDQHFNFPQMRGVNRSGLEFSCIKGFGIFDGPSDDNSIEAIKKWKTEIIRLPLNEDCWLGTNGVNSAFGGKKYRSAVIEYIQRLRKNGLSVIIDLHWTGGSYSGPGQIECSDKAAKCEKPMPDAENAPKFWKSVAKQFKDDNNIIFELFNNPFPDKVLQDTSLAWKCWKNGGKDCPGFGYKVAGMQELVNAVRNTKANNPVMLSGIRSGNDLSKWKEYVPNDPKKKIIASWHSFKENKCNTETCWEKEIAPISQEYPVIVGEIGEKDCSDTYINTLMDWLDKKHISYLGWTWNTWDCSLGPSLISDYNGTPTEFGKGLFERMINKDRKSVTSSGSFSSEENNSKGSIAKNQNLNSKTQSMPDQHFNFPQMRGVNRSGLEFSCIKGFGIFDGPSDDNSIEAIKKWKTEIIRLPLNEDCWLGTNGVNSAFGGEKYRSAVIEYIQRLRKNGLSVIIDLHWTGGSYSGPGQIECPDKAAKCEKPMPDAENAPKFWESVAKQFKDDNNIIFELFNNPFPDKVLQDTSLAWKCWKNGGEDCPGFGYKVAGMQELVNAVRNTKANNPVMLSGIRSGNDLSKWKEYVPNDPKKKIIASWHSFKENKCNTETCWEKEIAPISQEYPVIVGEIGEKDCSDTYINTLMDWLDKKHISYLGWTWNTWDCSLGPSLISDYNGTPTEFGKGLFERMINKDRKSVTSSGSFSSEENNSKGSKNNKGTAPVTSSGSLSNEDNNKGSSADSNNLSSTQKQLRGVNRSGTEYSCVKNLGIFEGPVDDASVEAMKTWNINIVRVPMNEDCWLGINGHETAYIGENYRKAVIDFVNRLRNHDLKVILDLHWTDGIYGGPGKGDCYDTAAKCQKPMPDKENAPEFWKSVAEEFKNDDGIIFDLFNEPFPDMIMNDKSAAWKCLRDGGSACIGFNFDVAGMQDLVNAVRSTGAKNQVMVGGLSWSNDLSQWLQYLPTDSENNIAASWHSYDFNACNNKACWESQIAPVAAKFPVIVGEIGQHGCAHNYIDDLMKWLDEKKINYLGWTWNIWDCSNGPSLITDFNGSPTEFGKGLKNHLQSENI